MLVSNIGEKEKELFINYNELSTLQVALIEQEMYHNGVKDGLRILTMVGGEIFLDNV